jgi:hypothetical protein
MKDARQLLSAPCQETLVCDIITSTPSTPACLFLLFLLAAQMPYTFFDSLMLQTLNVSRTNLKFN